MQGRHLLMILAGNRSPFLTLERESLRVQAPGQSNPSLNSSSAAVLF